MLDDLEKFIKENREKFDSEEPQANHQERFERKRDERFNFFKRKNRSWLLVAASILVLCSLGSIWMLNKSVDETSINQMSLSEVSPEMEEVEHFMLTSIADKIAYLKSNFPENREHVSQGISGVEKLEMKYQELKTILYENREEVIVNSMIMNYQMRLELIDILIEELQ